MEIMKPGCLLWGGSDPIQHGQQIPFSAIQKWEDDVGWKDQYHNLWVEMSRMENNPQGLRTQINLAERVVAGGGFAHIMVMGTPRSLASVSTSIRGSDGRLVYPKHPPINNRKWAKKYLELVQQFINVIPIDKISFDIWVEPNRYWWRGSNRQFYEFYDVVQRAMLNYQLKSGVKLNFGGTQIGDILDWQTGLSSPFYTVTKTLIWLARFFSLAKKNGWQIDEVVLFQYGNLVEPIISRVLEIEGLMLDYDIDADLVFSSISPMTWGSPFTEQEEGRYVMKLAKEIMVNTSVSRGNFDFIEDVGSPDMNRSQPNGLLEYETLREKVKWDVATKIIAKGDFNG